MNTIDEQIAVLQAYKEGKTIEHRYDNDYSGWTDWYTVKEYGGTPYNFNFANEEYRIAEEPKYRPFGEYDLPELMQSIRRHGEFVKAKDKDKYYAITGFGSINLELGYNGSVSYEGLLRGYVWADDGSPCGVKID